MASETPTRSLFITGTDTGVGKTHASAVLLHMLARRHARVVGMKPVAAGLVPHEGRWVSEDAMALRAERALRDPTRDQQRMLEVQPFAKALDEARRRGIALEPGWQALRWDLEELRVSLFAQELGTRRQVSAKRLARQLEALT